MCYLSYHSPLNEVRFATCNTGLIEGYSGDHAGSDAIFITEGNFFDSKYLLVGKYLKKF